MVKDYYKILEISPGANQKEIKKSFRKLALRFHPDKNPGNKYALAWYNEIKEAYETLSDSDLRKVYIQDRWLLRSKAKKFDIHTPLTPEFILKKIIQLERQIAEMDHFRMSHPDLQKELLNALPDEQIDALHAYDEGTINKTIVQTILHACDPLDYPFLPPVLLQLQKLQGNNREIAAMINSYERKRAQQHLMDKYQGWLILLISILLCAAIYFLNR